MTNKTNKEIHKPVIDSMNSIGYRLLKDGETFYESGMELAPRQGITFSMRQAYVIHYALQDLASRIATAAKEEGARKALEGQTNIFNMVHCKNCQKKAKKLMQELDKLRLSENKENV